MKTTKFENINTCIIYLVYIDSLTNGLAAD